MSREEQAKYISEKLMEDPEFKKAFVGAITDAVNEVVKAIKALQPEPLTDKEQRIFLAAMGKEEKVCKQVDDECRDCREPYEDSLVKTCHEITRKVKGALWTI